MKKLYVLLALFLSLITAAQSPNWLWAKNAESTSGDYGIEVQSIGTDGNRNVYVTGNFYTSAVTFGSITLTKTQSSVDNIFIVKYDSSGNVIWAKSAGGTSVDFSYGISTDVKGNVYVTGSFEDTTITFGSTILTNAGNEDMFVVKYDSSGNVVWAKNTGGTGGAFGSGISTDGNCNVYITGHFFRPAVTFESITLTNVSDTDYFFMVKYDSSGNVVWAKSAGAIGSINDSNGHNSISTDSNGHVYVMGVFTSPTITFGANTLTNNSLGDGCNIFVVKYDTSGNVIWAESAGEPGMSVEQGFNSISTDYNGNAYVTGFFSSPTIAFGSNILTNNSAGLCDNNNIFIVKYDASGNVVWAKGEGGTGSVGGDICISTDGNGNSYITGGFDSPTFTVGSTTLTSNSLPCGSNIFIAKYDSSGNVIWAESAGGTGSDFSTAISTNADGNGYITGFFTSPTIAFGATTLTNDTTGFFIAKFRNNITNGVANENTSLGGISVYPNPSNGTVYFKGGEKGYKIQIYDLLGTTIYATSAITDNFCINLDREAKGIYFYKIFNNLTTIQEGKVILE